MSGTVSETEHHGHVRADSLRLNMLANLSADSTDAIIVKKIIYQ